MSSNGYPRWGVVRCALAIAILFTAFSWTAPIKAEPQPHYWLGRPISSSGYDRAELGFPYGGTRNGASPTHHGVDMPNRRGTPVLAAADGTVYYAGSDKDKVFGPQPNFYGNVIVIRHDMVAPEGGTVFTLYGHLDRIDVQAGRRIGKGQPIGAVGKSGIALWYHLHFEVRVNNPDDYNATRNPELWYAPKAGRGNIIGRMVDANGGLAMGIRYTLSTKNGVFPGFTYADPSIQNDPSYGENFVMNDVVAGCYRLRVKNGKGGYAYDQQVCVRVGETVFVEVKLAPL